MKEKTVDVSAVARSAHLCPEHRRKKETRDIKNRHQRKGPGGPISLMGCRKRASNADAMTQSPRGRLAHLPGILLLGDEFLY